MGGTAALAELELDGARRRHDQGVRSRSVTIRHEPDGRAIRIAVGCEPGQIDEGVDRVGCHAGQVGRQDEQRCCLRAERRASFGQRVVEPLGFLQDRVRAHVASQAEQDHVL